MSGNLLRNSKIFGEEVEPLLHTYTVIRIGSKVDYSVRDITQLALVAASRENGIVV